MNQYSLTPIPSPAWSQFFWSLQVVGRDGEQRSADERADCRKAGGGAAGWSRCWSRCLVMSNDGADGCGSEENGAGDLLHLHCDFLLFGCGVVRWRGTRTIQQSPKNAFALEIAAWWNEMESMEFIGGNSSDFRWKVSSSILWAWIAELKLEKPSWFTGEPEEAISGGKIREFWEIRFEIKNFIIKFTKL